MSFVKAPGSVGHALHRSVGSMVSSAEKVLRYNPAIDPHYDNVILLLEGESVDKSKKKCRLSSARARGFNNGVITVNYDVNENLRIDEVVAGDLTVGLGENFTVEGRWKALDSSGTETPAFLRQATYNAPTGSTVFYYVRGGTAGQVGNMVLEVSGQANVSRSMPLVVGQEYEIALTRVGTTYYWHQDGVYLGQVSSHQAELVFGPALVLYHGSTASAMEISRIRLTKGVARYGPANYTVPDKYYPFDEVIMHPNWKDTVFCIDGDVVNSLTDITGRHSPIFTEPANAAWDSVNKQTARMYMSAGIRILPDANIEDFRLEGDFTIDARVAVDFPAGSSGIYATILNGLLWLADTTTEALGLIWLQGMQTQPTLVLRNYAGTISGFDTFPDAARHIWTNGAFNDIRFVRKNGRTRVYMNGVALNTEAPGTNTQKLLFVDPTAGRGTVIGIRGGPAENIGVIVKRLRITKTALNDPFDLNYRVPRNFLE